MNHIYIQFKNPIEKHDNDGILLFIHKNRLYKSTEERDICIFFIKEKVNEESEDSCVLRKQKKKSLILPKAES